MFFWLSLCGLFVIRLWLSAFGGLHPDEAYYWFWSQNLSLGYFDHPPMIAWVIAASEKLTRLLIPESFFIEDPLFYSSVSIRFLPYFLSTAVTPFLAGKCVEVVQQRKLTITQIAAFLTLPLVLLGPQVITPDTPFFTCWTLVLYFHLLILRQRPIARIPGDQTPFQMTYAVAIGVFLALGAYSKYSAVLAVFLLLITGLGVMNALVAGLVCFMLLVPYMLWNYEIGYPSGSGVFFQFKNGLGNLAQGLYRPNYKWAGDLIVSQILFWSPLVFLSVFYFPLKDLRNVFAQRRLDLLTGSLFCWSVLPLAFFFITSLQRRAEANWPWVGAIAASILTLTRLRRHVTALWVLIFTNIAMVVLAYIILTQGPWFATKFESVPKVAEQLRRPSRLLEFQDWDRFYELTYETTRIDEHPILVRSYQVLSELLYYDSTLPGSFHLKPRLKIWGRGSRISEYNFHKDYKDTENYNNYWILSEGNTLVPSHCKEYSTVYRGLKNTRAYTFFRCVKN